MKLLSFKKGDKQSIGVLVEGKILDLGQALSIEFGESYESSTLPKSLDMLSLLSMGRKGMSEIKKVVDKNAGWIRKGETVVERMLVGIDEIEFLAPIPRPLKNIVCLGLNYADHVTEGNARREKPRPLPEHPIFFTKTPTAVTGPFSDIIYPKVTELLDYEVELAIVIGKGGRYIDKKKVYEHIAGYTAFNDISARDLQRRHGQWFRGKSLDSFAPMGPYLVDHEDIGNPQNLDVWLKVNGEKRQSSNTSNMIFDIKTIVSTLSAGITLEPGDIIATGTPSGVGSSHPLGLLKVGDIVETGIEKIGVMRNKVVAED
jgi:2-keto-4-pentenoate hydratase/2-oxohepta-3-ene-1,7-dioic acid hydratase in catechol pathway